LVITKILRMKEFHFSLPNYLLSLKKVELIWAELFHQSQVSLLFATPEIIQIFYHDVSLISDTCRSSLP